MRGDRSRRTLAIGIVVLAVAAAWAVDRAISTSPGPGPAVPAIAIRAPVGATTSAWYCSGTGGLPKGNDAGVLVTNAGNRSVSVDVESFAVTSPSGAAGPARPSGIEPVTVPAGSQVALPVAAGAAEVLVHGGAVGVAEELAGPLGWTDAPCAGAASSRWYFPQGKTAAGAGLQLVLFDPLPTPAVANVSFLTTTGAVVEPPAYQGVSVEPGAVLVENVGDHVPDGTFATEVTAPSGAVVADEVEEGANLGKGWMSILAGVDAPETTWAFPESADVPNGSNYFTVFDPSDQAATVTVSFALNLGQATPLVLHVSGHATIGLAAESQTRIPPGSTFGVQFTSSVPGVVVSRATLVPGATPANTGVTGGIPGRFRRWVVPEAPPGRLPLHLALFNLGRQVVRVTLTRAGAAGGAVPTSPPITVRPGSAIVVAPTPTVPIGMVPTEITADGPVAAELELAPGGAPGVSVFPAWPLLGSPS